MRAALYARVSTFMQERDGVSLDAQKDMALDFCRRKGWEFVGDFIDVESGTSDKRESLGNLMAAAKRRQFDAVICYKVDRLSRNSSHFHEVKDLLEENRVEIVSLTQDIDTSTASGRLLLNILIGIAQNESEQIGERVSMAIRYKASQGTYTPARVPLGYRYIPKAIGPNGERIPARIEVDEEEAEVVRLAFSLFVELRSCRATAIRLNELGHRTKRGTPFRNANLNRILRNPIYKGDRVFGRHKKQRAGRKKIVVKQPASRWMIREGEAPAILEGAIWEQAQAILDGNAAINPRRAYSVNRYTWTGILECAGCGSHLTRTHYFDKRVDWDRVSYVCSLAHSSGKAACSVYARTSEPFLAGALLPVIAEAFDRAALAERGKITAIKAKPVRKADRGRMLAETKAEKEREMFLFRKGHYRTAEEIEAFEKRIEELDERIASISVEQEDAPPALPVLPAAFMDAWERLPSDGDRGRLLRALIRCVRIDKASATVEFHLLDNPHWPKEPITVPIRRVRRWQKKPATS